MIMRRTFHTGTSVVMCLFGLHPRGEHVQEGNVATDLTQDSEVVDTTDDDATPDAALQMTDGRAIFWWGEANEHSDIRR